MYLDYVDYLELVKLYDMTDNLASSQPHHLAMFFGQARMAFSIEQYRPLYDGEDVTALTRPDRSGQTAFITGSTQEIANAIALALADQGCNSHSTTALRAIPRRRRPRCSTPNTAVSDRIRFVIAADWIGQISLTGMDFAGCRYNLRTKNSPGVDVQTSKPSSKMKVPSRWTSSPSNSMRESSLKSTIMST